MTPLEHRKLVAALLVVAYEAGQETVASLTPTEARVFKTYEWFLARLDDQEEERETLRQLARESHG